MYTPSLLRVVFVILSSYSFHRSVTPPAPGARNKERVVYANKKSGRFDISLFPAQGLLTVIQAVIHLFNIFELTYSIYAWMSPSSHATPPPPTQSSSSFFLGVVLMVAGTCLRIACYATLGRHFTLELSLQPAHRLVTAGPYALVRHPSYTGALLLYAGLLLSQTGPASCWAQAGMWEGARGRAVGALYWALVVFANAVMLTRMAKEDAVLRETFGGEWDAWARRTPYRLVPYVY